MPTKPTHNHRINESGTEYHTYSPNIQMMMQELLHTLANIDLQHEAELEKLIRSTTDEELKKYIKEKLRARHRERREPYVNLLGELRRQQHSMAFAS